MFGVVRPCGCRLSEGLRAGWTAHLCGLCLALRAEHGQRARLVTNYDGLLASVLVEAQVPMATRTAGPCALRGMRTATVVTGDGARLAAAASLTLAAAKASDHAEDGDTRAPAVARRLARSWAAAGARTGAAVGFDTGVLRAAAARQAAVEAAVGPGDPVEVVTEPTETAVGAVFGHTAVLAGRPENAAALTAAGWSFGRLAHLLDAVEDLDDDRARGRWNPLLATGTGRAAARALCDRAAADVAAVVRSLALPALAHTLLAHEVPYAVRRTFDQPPGTRPRRPVVLGCLVAAGMCLTGQFCCEHENPWTRRRHPGWCESCDCSGCDAGGCDCCCDGCDCCSC